MVRDDVLLQIRYVEHSGFTALFYTKESMFCYIAVRYCVL